MTENIIHYLKLEFALLHNDENDNLEEQGLIDLNLGQALFFKVKGRVELTDNCMYRLPSTTYRGLILIARIG